MRPLSRSIRSLNLRLFYTQQPLAGLSLPSMQGPSNMWAGQEGSVVTPPLTRPLVRVQSGLLALSKRCVGRSLRCCRLTVNRKTYHHFWSPDTYLLPTHAIILAGQTSTLGLPVVRRYHAFASAIPKNFICRSRGIPTFLPALTFAAGCALIRGKPGGIFMIHFHPEGTSRGISAVWGFHITVPLYHAGFRFVKLYL